MAQVFWLKGTHDPFQSGEVYLCPAHCIPEGKRMILLLLLILLLMGIDPAWWVWLLVLVGEPLFWLVTINIFNPPRDY